MALSEKTMKIICGKIIQCLYIIKAFFFLRRRYSFSHLSTARRRLELASTGNLVITLAARFCDFCNLSPKPGCSNQTVVTLMRYKFELQPPSE